ncbi:MAG TPA: 16S rRNA (cytidine(1402)-2'-O)-methyltransferase [Candidatus Sulfotelmatobacter sp.]|nr:16S rRNA (cytidine(1402)-2'-O)-methyltransferase [Candidatus Sulfotelmatobacter sp.]
MGNLYIVSTPIGNLQDITLRAIEVLKSVDFIAAEDTRKTAVLLRHFFTENSKQMTDKLISYYEEVESQKISQVINLLVNGKNVALVSDAGTPTISDPGFKLVREAISNNIKVVSIPGPTSLISALVSSGLPTDKFLFLGFLPQKPGHRVKMLENAKKSLEIINSTVIIFESPHKLKKSLEDILEVFGDIDIVVARELTKIYEEVIKEKVLFFINKYQNKTPKGEIVILFNLK